MPPTLKETRLDDHLIKTDVEEKLESANKGAAYAISIYSIVMIVTGIVFNKSLTQLWNMLNSIQFFYYIKFINYSWPWIIYSSLDYYSLVCF